MNETHGDFWRHTFHARTLAEMFDWSCLQTLRNDDATGSPRVVFAPSKVAGIKMSFRGANGNNWT